MESRETAASSAQRSLVIPTFLWECCAAGSGGASYDALSSAAESNRT